jgi:peptidylprolyl isomerase
VASTRQRERELQRARQQRRAARLAEQRARRRRRNAIIGATLSTLAVIGVVVGLVLANTGGSSKSKATHAASSSPSTASKLKPTTAACTVTPGAPSTVKGFPALPKGANRQLADKPVVHVSSSCANPAGLITKDLIAGSGPGATKGKKLTVNYVGVGLPSGAEFDSSWKGGAPFSVTLGAGQVIPGWDKGLVGMKVGGRRELVIPASLAYGASGYPPSIQPNEPLVFVVDLLKMS